MFFAGPLAAKGLPMAQRVVEVLLLAMVAVVVLLSQRRGAILAIALGLVATFASRLFGPVAARVLDRGGDMLAFSAATWVVAHAVYAPGRITFHRLQGAVVVYLNFAMIFASAFGLIWELSPVAYAGLPAAMGAPGESATMIYFSLTTLDDDRLRRHRAGRTIRPRLGEFRIGHGPTLSCHYGGAPGRASTAGPASLIFLEGPRPLPPDLLEKTLQPLFAHRYRGAALSRIREMVEQPGAAERRRNANDRRSAFFGNRLGRGELRDAAGVRIDLRNIKSPIIVFCSWGDDITPAHQALHWILDLYDDDSDIVAAGQTIVYCVHTSVGHLGIFVSGKVAAKEHGEFAQSMDLIDLLPPGLYEAVISGCDESVENPGLVCIASAQPQAIERSTLVPLIGSPPRRRDGGPRPPHQRVEIGDAGGGPGRERAGAEGAGGSEFGRQIATAASPPMGSRFVVQIRSARSRRRHG